MEIWQLLKKKKLKKSDNRTNTPKINLHIYVNFFRLVFQYGKEKNTLLSRVVFHFVLYGENFKKIAKLF
jgi:hypothetical protein